MNYKFEHENHVHLLEGFYDPLTHDYYKIKNIKITNNNYGTIVTQIPITNERLRLTLKNYIEKDIIWGKYDNKIQYPANFKLEDFDNCSIEIEHIITNEHKQLYKLKQYYYEYIENQQKANKYQYKLETPAYTNNEIKVFTGGSQLPLIKDIPDNICTNVAKEKPKSVIGVYSEPLTRALFDILENVCRTQLKLYIDPNEFVYVKNESSKRMYYSQCSGGITFGEFDAKYNNLFDMIDQRAKMNGLNSRFDDEYVQHFKRETFENNTWKSRIMAHHLISHKYAHNGIGGDEFADVLKMIFMLDLDLASHMWGGFHFIHSLAHVYDDIYMRPVGSPRMQDKIQTLDKIKRDMFGSNIQQYDCLRKMMNTYRSDFLVKTGNNFNQPYQIKPDAINDKKRQYMGWFSHDVLPEFNIQLRNRPYTKTGETNKTVHEDEV